MALSFTTGRSLLLLSLAAYFASADLTLINSICSMTNNRPLCLQVFRSSINADRAGLGQTAVRQAMVSTKSTSNLIAGLAIKKTDPMVKEQYETCLTLYNKAHEYLNECNSSLTSKDFKGANKFAMAALEDAQSCGDEAITLPTQVKVAAQKVADYVNIVYFASKV